MTPVVIFFIGFLVPAMLEPAEVETSGGSLQERIASLLDDPMLAKADAGFEARRIDDGSVIARRNADMSLLIASNTKLVTTAAALEILGGDFVFRTPVYWRGRIADGTLDGDLLVVGGGDPNISGRFHQGNPCAVFERWAEALRAKGVRSVRGDIRGDDGLFDRQFWHSSWAKAERDRWYMAPVSALSLNDNCVDVTVSPGSADGVPARVALSPPTGFVSLLNRCRTTDRASRHTVAFSRPVGSRRITVSGAFWIKAAPWLESVAVEDPGRYFLVVFKETLERKGISVMGEVRLVQGEDAKGWNLLDTFTSTLVDTLRVTNKNSQNFYAEHLLKMIGSHASGSASFEGGCAAAREVLDRLGVRGDYDLADGSGLSRDNRLSASQVVTLLTAMAGRRGGDLYRDTLPVMGVDGSLKSRGRNAILAGRVRAKTGHLSFTNCLSGYVIGRDGREIAFSFLVNRFRGSRRALENLQETICRILAGF
ncbi:MAG: D-alanyl-D-alanine carboxypeptidase/D-alanyl-D-alanine-endopeptidase [Planctomycetota bacterium]